MDNRLAVLIGLVRDFISAGIGLAILFGLQISQQQIAGILLVVTTAAALFTWVYNSFYSGTPRP